MADIATATLKPREERRLLRGHLWGYRNEFEQLPPAEDGDLVDVFTAKRRFLGRGFYQATGGIAVRLLTRHQEEIDKGFFMQRIADAQALRERVLPGESTYRWVFGESDGLPGFVADRYGNVVSGKSACTFYSHHADRIAKAFLAAGAAAVQLDLPGGVRTYGDVPSEITGVINGITLAVDLAEAQKTGLFLDQRLNIAAACRFAEGAHILDAHCYVGAWSCALAKAGAASVRGVDTSARAIAQAEANATRNGTGDTCRFEIADVATVLTGEPIYDMVILDPPALAKARGQQKKALGLYQSLNAAAMQTLKPGGILVTSSCSHFVAPADFEEMLKRASATARRSVLQLELRGAAPDHPVLLSMPETEYLCCAILAVR